jgi:hypothetical protein
MFGRNKATHTGMATVVLSQMIDNGRVKYDRGHRVHRYDLVVDVKPDDADAPFRAEASEWFSPTYSPRKGDAVKVTYGEEHKKVDLDIEGDPRFDLAVIDKAAKSATKSERERLLEGGPGTP